jgi:hypothetical protein
LKVNKEPFSFIFTASVNTFQNQYNLKQFIHHIWQPLLLKDKRWKLYVTGNKHEVLEAALKIDLEKNNIISLGFVDDVQAAIESKKYFVSPTYVGSGLRIKVLNALAQGAVCFATSLDVNMLNKLKDEDNIVQFDSFDEFYSKLLRLEGNNTLYNKISLQAVLVAKTLSWRNYVDTVYNEIVKIEDFTGR